MIKVITPCLKRQAYNMKKDAYFEVKIKTRFKNYVQ